MGQYGYNTPEDAVSSASILDKTDWRRTIHTSLENCVKSEGTYPHFIRAVQRMISVVGAPYPGFDAKKIIIAEQRRLKKNYQNQWDTWITEHETSRRRVKERQKKKLSMEEHYELYVFVRDLLARKRILLYGTRQISGGTQAPDPE